MSFKICVRELQNCTEQMVSYKKTFFWFNTPPNLPDAYNGRTTQTSTFIDPSFRGFAALTFNQYQISSILTGVHHNIICGQNPHPHSPVHTQHQLHVTTEFCRFMTQNFNANQEVAPTSYQVVGFGSWEHCQFLRL